MNLARCKRRTLIDVYGFYKYKKNIPHPIGTVPVPFIKKSECTDHKLSVDWYEWQDVVLAYIEKLKIHLEEGNTIEVGSKTGEFHLIKFKAPSFIDFKKSKEQGKTVKFKFNNLEGNPFIATAWARRRIHLKLRSFWKIKLNRAWLRSIYESCEKDYTKIYKIRDSKS